MDSIAVILIVIGILFLIAEIFIPSFGITGGVGVVAILIGVVMTADTIMGGIVMFTALLILAIVLMVLTYKVFASKKGPLVLKSKLQNEDHEEELKVFVGKKGKALTPLRPAGSADIEGVRLDVLTQGEFVEKNANVVVDKIQGKKIIVKQV